MNHEDLARILEARAAEIGQCPVVTGFDGFVDEMISLVDQRHDLEKFDRVETIDRFGDLIKAAAGQSSLREIVVTQIDPGGCAVNMGDGLVALGLPVSTFATVGDPIDSAFSDYASKATLHSWGEEPGRTLAYEFMDGKVMFSSVSHLAKFTAEHVLHHLADGVFTQACRGTKLIALTDWSLYPHMTECWREVNQSVFAKLTHRPHLFLDLVDPSSRSTIDILEMLLAISEFEANCPTSLGLNQNEANILCRLLELPFERSPEAPSAALQAQALRERIAISEVVIHTHHFAVSASQESSAAAAGPYCACPIKSTGAGDRFNAGYALGLVLDLPAEARLLLGNTISGGYVRTGQSPALADALDLLRDWPEAENSTV